MIELAQVMLDQHREIVPLADELGRLPGAAKTARVNRLEALAAGEGRYRPRLRRVGVIHLEQLTELDRPVPLAELRANRVPFARNIVSGKALNLDEVATLLELGGLGVTGHLAAAESRGEDYRDSG